MSQNLPNHTNDTPAIPDIDALTGSGQPFNRMILIGTPEWVRGVISRLHTLGFADVGAWSRMIPTRNPGEMISVLMRSRV